MLVFVPRVDCCVALCGALLLAGCTSLDDRGLAASDPGREPETPWCAALPWSARFGSDAGHEVMVSAVSPMGETLLAGVSYGPLDFGIGEPVVPTTFGAVFAVLLDANGHPRWARELAWSNGYVLPVAGDLDAEGNAWIAGDYVGSVTIGDFELTAQSRKGFVAKLDPEGEVTRLFTTGGSGQVFGRFLRAVGSEILFGGAFEGELLLGGQHSFDAVPSRQVFVARLDHLGRTVAARRIGNYYADLSAAAVSATGRVVLSGSFAGEIALDDRVLLGPIDASNVYLLTLDPNGATGFGAVFDGSGNLDGKGKLYPPSAIAVDAAGGVALGGPLFGEVDFGGGPVVRPPDEVDGLPDLYLARLGADGGHLWSQHVHGVYAEEIASLAFDGVDLLVGGSFSGSVVFGRRGLVAAGSLDMFAVRLSGSGEATRLLRFGDGAAQRTQRLLPFCGGSVIAGCCRGQVAFTRGSSSGDDQTCDVCAARLDL